MVCCFMNLHQQENAKDLEAHFDREIDIAIGRGCSVFVCGNKYPEDEIFAKRVMNMAKYYAEGEIKLFRMEEECDHTLKIQFINMADWEIYAYKCDRYPLHTNNKKKTASAVFFLLNYLNYNMLIFS